MLSIKINLFHAAKIQIIIDIAHYFLLVLFSTLCRLIDAHVSQSRRKAPYAGYAPLTVGSCSTTPNPDGQPR